MKKILSFIFILFSVLLLVSCGSNKNTASVKDAAAKLANEIDRVGTPTKMLEISNNEDKKLTSYKLMSYNSYNDNSNSDSDIYWENGNIAKWEEYNTVDYYNYYINYVIYIDDDKDALSKVKTLIDNFYETAIKFKNEILKYNNPYMYAWNEQENGINTRISFDGNKLILEESAIIPEGIEVTIPGGTNIIANKNEMRSYIKVYVEHDSDNKLFYEVIISSNYSYTYCKYYEEKEFVYYTNSYDRDMNMISEDGAIIDISNGYPIVIVDNMYKDSSKGNRIHNIEYLGLSDDNFIDIKMELSHGKRGLIKFESIINEKIYLTYNGINTLILPVNDKFIESVKFKKCKTDYEGELILQADYTFKNKNIMHSYYDYGDTNMDYFYSDKYNKYHTAAAYISDKNVVFYINHFVPEDIMEYDGEDYYYNRGEKNFFNGNNRIQLQDFAGNGSSFKETEGILRKYGYLDENEEVDSNFIDPKFFGKYYEELESEYIMSSIIKQVPEKKSYEEYIKDFDNAEELKKPFEMEVNYDLSGIVTVSEDSIDFSNLTLKINKVEIKNVDYVWNMYNIDSFKIYYKDKLIKTVKNKVVDGVAVMEPFTVEFDEKNGLKEYFEREDIKAKPDTIRIEIYGVGVNIEVTSIEHKTEEEK